MNLNKILLFLSLLFGFEQIQAQVTADFSADTTAGCDPLVVSFTDESSGNIASWQWSFSDGQSSELQNPTMTFTGEGYYSVTLVVTEDGTGDTDTMTVADMIHVVANPHASFQVGDNNTGCIPLDVDFTDLSTSNDGDITSWSWDMGDGSILSDQNPTHTYTSSGIYNVHLQVTTEYGCVDDTTINNAVHASTVPDIQIDADITQYCSVPVDIHFTNNSTGSATQTDFSWSFGDGNTSTDENPVNTYTDLGTYDVSLTVTDEYGCSNSDTFPDFIQLNQVVAAFVTNPVDTVCLGSETQFINQSGIYCNWDFGDGTGMNHVTEDTVVHTYTQSGLYTVTLIAAPGDPCADTITKDIFVQRVTAGFTADKTKDCKVPFTVHFVNQSSSNVVSWSWDFGDTTYSTQQNPSNTYDSLGDYDVSLTVTTSAGCSADVKLSDYIQIHPPVVDFVVDPPGGGCVPLTLFFQDSSTTSIHDTAWQWHFDGGVPDTAITDTVSVVYNSAGAFAVTLTIVNDSGCAATIVDSVRVGSHQTPNFIQTHDTICASDSMSFLNLSFNADLIDSNFWYTIPIDSTGEPGDTNLISTEESLNEYYVYHDGIVSDTGLFNVMLVTDYYGCKDTLYVDSALYVHGPILKHIYSTFSCDTLYSVTFIADIEDGINWDWDFGDGDTIMYSVEDTITHVYDTAGTFWVKVNVHNDSTGCDYLDSTKIQVTNVQAILTMPHKNCNRDTVLLDGSNSIDANSYYFDFGDGGNSGWGSASSNIHTFGADTFFVSLIVKDIHMCTDTATDTLYSVQPVAIINIDTSNGCTPLPVSFNADSSNSDFGISSYYWHFSDDGSSSYDTTLTHIFTREGTFTVRLIVHDSLGCYDWATQSIKVYQAHAKIIPEDTTLCRGIPVSFYGNDTTYAYQWAFGNNQTASGDTVSVTYNTDSSFVVQQVATDTHGCIDTAYQNVDVQGVDIVLNVIDTNISCYVTTPLTDAYIQNQTDTIYGTQWLWNFGDSVFSTNYNPGHYYSSPDIFHVSLQATTAYGCVDNDSVWLNVFGPYAVLEIPHDTFCKGEQFTISLNDTMNVEYINGTFGDGNAFTYVPYDYAYSTTGMMDIDINLYSESSHQCGMTLHDSVYVIRVNAYFSVYDSSDDTARCASLTVNFTDTSQGANTWHWDFGDGDTYSGETPPAHTYQNSGVQDQTYTIRLAIADQNGCVDTAEHQVIVYGTPEISVSPDQFICKGDSVQLQATANASGGSPYFIWSPPGGLSDTSVYNPYAFPDTSTLYNVTVYSQHNCSNQDSVMITVQNAPSVTYSPDTTIMIGNTADLFIYADQPNVTFNWTPDYGLNCTNCTNVYAQPLETTIYQVSYEDSAGCFLKNVNITVFVDERYTIDVPTAFTPNGDGKNDVVYVKGWGIKNLLEFSIYNRWGEKIFTTDDINQGWDGTFKGKPQNIDTYVYYVKGELYSGKEVAKKGTINLFR